MDRSDTPMATSSNECPSDLKSTMDSFDTAVATSSNESLSYLDRRSPRSIPLELRRMVWDFALPRPEAINIVFMAQAFRKHRVAYEKSSVYMEFPPSFLNSRRDINLLRLCHESREETLNEFHYTDVGKHRRPLYFNLAQDTFRFAIFDYSRRKFAGTFLDGKSFFRPGSEHFNYTKLGIRDLCQNMQRITFAPSAARNKSTISYKSSDETMSESDFTWSCRSEESEAMTHHPDIDYENPALLMGFSRGLQQDLDIPFPKVKHVQFETLRSNRLWHINIDRWKWGFDHRPDEAKELWESLCNLHDQHDPRVIRHLNRMLRDVNSKNWYLSRAKELLKWTQTLFIGSKRSGTNMKRPVLSVLYPNRNVWIHEPISETISRHPNLHALLLDQTRWKEATEAPDILELFESDL